MQFGISTQILGRQTITIDALETLRRAGFERLEIFSNRPQFDFRNRRLLRSIGRWFEENALPAPSLHLPFLENAGPGQKIWISILDREPRHRAAALDELKRCLELSDYVRPAYVVMHLGNPGEAFSPLAFEHAYAAIHQIRSFADVDVMIENIPNDISTIERIQEFKAVAETPEIGICYDTGHGHIQQVHAGFEHINTAHVHDNNGSRDEHLWPFEGTLKWTRLIERLVVAEYRGPFIFETRGDIGKSGEVRGRLQNLWDEAASSIDEYRLKYKL